MTDIPLDTTLDVMVLIFGVILLIMPLFFNGFQKKIEVKDRKGRLLRIDFDGLNTKGKILIAVCILSLTCGVWKAIRDDNTKNKFNGVQSNMKDTVYKLNEKVDKFKALVIVQYKADSAIVKKNRRADSIIFAKIQLGLKSRGLGLDKEFNITNYNQFALISMGANTKIGVVQITNSGVYNIVQPKKKQ